MRGPKTFTGENTVEITTHNNPFIIEQIISRLVACGATIARPGDFTQMAFLNGKLDLAKAEALHDVITAQSEHSLKVAMAQLQGSLSSYCKDIEQKLTELLCYVEASFEFLDEEQRDLDFDNAVRERVQGLSDEISRVIESFPVQEQIRQGVRIAFIGSVNAGKSTLFNTLIGNARAIVSDQAGTTRDTIEATKYHHGHFWTFIDTAGLRETDDVVEQQGIARSYSEAESADVVVLILDASRTLSLAEQEVYDNLFAIYAEKTVLVCSKVDLLPGHNKSVSLFGNSDDQVLQVSSAQGVGISELMAEIENRVNRLFSDRQAPFLLNARQRNILESLSQKIKSIQSLCAVSVEYELVAHHVHDALAELCELTGKNIYSRFAQMNM